MSPGLLRGSAGTRGIRSSSGSSLLLSRISSSPLEKPVTGANAAKAQAAAVKAVGSGSKAGDVTTDVSGNGYEVTVTKSDGSKVEVHLNGSFGLDDHGRLGG